LTCASRIYIFLFLLWPDLRRTAAVTEEELREMLAAMERVRAVHMATPEKARQFLIDSGVVDENGKLTEHYRSPA
jgi:hypothetical protein